MYCSSVYVCPRILCTAPKSGRHGRYRNFRSKYSQGRHCEPSVCSPILLLYFMDTCLSGRLGLVKGTTFIGTSGALEHFVVQSFEKKFLSKQIVLRHLHLLLVQVFTFHSFFFLLMYAVGRRVSFFDIGLR